VDIQVDGRPPDALFALKYRALYCARRLAEGALDPS
jgi:hypothetical protein